MRDMLEQGQSPPPRSTIFSILADMFAASWTIPKQELEGARRDRDLLRAQGVPTALIDARIEMLERINRGEFG